MLVKTGISRSCAAAGGSSSSCSSSSAVASSQGGIRGGSGGSGRPWPGSPPPPRAHIAGAIELALIAEASSSPMELGDHLASWRAARGSSPEIYDITVSVLVRVQYE